MNGCYLKMIKDSGFKKYSHAEENVWYTFLWSMLFVASEC